MAHSSNSDEPSQPILIPTEQHKSNPNRSITERNFNPSMHCCASVSFGLTNLFSVGDRLFIHLSYLRGCNETIDIIINSLFREKFGFTLCSNSCGSRLKYGSYNYRCENTNRETLKMRISLICALSVYYYIYRTGCNAYIISIVQDHQERFISSSTIPNQRIMSFSSFNRDLPSNKVLTSFRVFHQANTIW